MKNNGLRMETCGTPHGLHRRTSLIELKKKNDSDKKSTVQKRQTDPHGEERKRNKTAMKLKQIHNIFVH